MTEEETTAFDEESEETESSIYRIEKINRIVDTNKDLTMLVKLNGIDKEYIMDSCPRISIVPTDIFLETKIQIVKRRCQAVNKIEVKFRGTILTKIEHEDCSQMML